MAAKVDPNVRPPPVGPNEPVPNTSSSGPPQGGSLGVADSYMQQARADLAEFERLAKDSYLLEKESKEINIGLKNLKKGISPSY